MHLLHIRTLDCPLNMYILICVNHTLLWVLCPWAALVNTNQMHHPYLYYNYNLVS